MNRRRGRAVRAAVLLSASFALFTAFGLAAAQEHTPQTGAPVFEKDVLPIFKANQCLTCHGPNLKIKDMNLSTFQGAMQGSEGGPVVVPGKPVIKSLAAVCEDAAVLDTQLDSSGVQYPKQETRENLWYATRMKETQEPSWIAPYWQAILTKSSRA